MIHLDHNATSPVLPEVRDAMAPWWAVPANPSSVHTSGRTAAAAVEAAAEHVAALVGMRADGVVFTSGATEANHTWFHAMRAAGRADSVAVGRFEHPCVRAAAERCETVVDLPMDPSGRAILTGVPRTDGTSLMAVNHETGVVQPIEQLRHRDGWRHIDATAAAGRMALDLGWADAVVISAHKLGGPMGVGALLLSMPSGDPFEPLLAGGGQQRGRRAGTIPTPLAVGFGEAARLALELLDVRRERWATLRELLVGELNRLGGRVAGQGAVPSVVNVIFAGIPAEAVVQALDLKGVAVSAGAACSSGAVQASPVLEAMGEAEPDGGVRISMGPHTTHRDIDALLMALPSVLEGARLLADL